MKSIEQLADEIVTREGGFVNDPDDPGGATNYGVTLGTLQRLGRDLNGDGRVDVTDLRRITPAMARDIFISEYYLRPGLNRLPDQIRPVIFDMYVNAGSRAVMILQQLLNDMGQQVQVDGLVGPRTIAAAQAADAVAAGHFVDAYAIARRNYYYRLADDKPALRKFARRRDGGKGGWIRRAEEFMQPRYRLSDAEHARRVAAWA
jgi:lysozyme family protein